MENQHIIGIGVFLLAFVILYVFMKIRQKNVNQYINRIAALNMLIVTNKIQIEARKQYLDRYDFLKYNLKEVLEIQPMIKL